MTENKQPYCSVLTAGQTLIYTVNERGNWEEPCFVSVAWKDENTPTLHFSPFALFNQVGEIEPIDERHILASYMPDSAVENNYQQFVDAYHAELSERRTQ